MRVSILFLFLLFGGCATSSIIQSEQLGRIQSLQNAENPHDQTEPNAVAHTIIDQAFTERFNLLCNSSVAEFEGYNEDYEELYAPEVALLTEIGLSSTRRTASLCPNAAYVRSGETVHRG